MNQLDRVAAGIDLRIGLISRCRRFSEFGEPRRSPHLGVQSTEKDHAAAAAFGRERPYLPATSVARLMKSSRISSLVRCLIFHLRKISLFFDFEPPKNFGRYGQYSFTAACSRALPSGVFTSSAEKSSPNCAWKRSSGMVARARLR